MKSVSMGIGGFTALGLATYGAVQMAQADALLPLVLFVGLGGVMATFASSTIRKDKEDAIDADEITPPTRQRRKSKASGTIDMNQEREMHRLELQEKDQLRKLADTRSKMKTIKLNEYKNQLDEDEYEDE